jgi:hypothetical protein
MFDLNSFAEEPISFATNAKIIINKVITKVRDIQSAKPFFLKKS